MTFYKPYNPECEWIAGGMEGIVHLDLIAFGGCSEVHQMRNTSTGAVCLLCYNKITVRSSLGR